MQRDDGPTPRYKTRQSSHPLPPRPHRSTSPRRQRDRHCPPDDFTFRGCHSIRRPCVRTTAVDAVFRSSLPCVHGVREAMPSARLPDTSVGGWSVREMDAVSAAGRVASSDGPLILGDREPSSIPLATEIDVFITGRSARSLESAYM